MIRYSAPDISNLDIKMLYIVNENSESKEWMNDIFVQTKFFADIRVKKYSNNVVPPDLRQEAYLGLWNAILSFDYQKNFDFYRWAQWNISKRLRDFTFSEKRVFDAKSNIKRELSNRNCKHDLYEEEVRLEMMIFAKNILSDNSNVLSKREKFILANSLVMGKTLKEISAPLNLSVERVRQLKQCGLSKLKSLMA